MEIDGVVLTPIPSTGVGFNNYLVDTMNGKIWSKISNKFLATGVNSNGYVYNSLVDDNGVRHAFGVHRLVMASFYGMPLEMFSRSGGLECDHIDEDLKHVNGIHNLQMSDRLGQYKPSTIERMSKPRPRLKESDVCEILEQLQELRNDEDFKISDFIKSMCLAYNREYRGMYNVITGKSFKHLHSQLV